MASTIRKQVGFSSGISSVQNPEIPKPRSTITTCQPQGGPTMSRYSPNVGVWGRAGEVDNPIRRLRAQPSKHARDSKKHEKNDSEHFTHMWSSGTTGTMLKQSEGSRIMLLKKENWTRNPAINETKKEAPANFTGNKGKTKSDKIILNEVEGASIKNAEKSMSSGSDWVKVKDKKTEYVREKKKSQKVIKNPPQAKEQKKQPAKQPKPSQLLTISDMIYSKKKTITNKQKINASGCGVTKISGNGQATINKIITRKDATGDVISQKKNDISDVSMGTEISALTNMLKREKKSKKDHSKVAVRPPLNSSKEKKPIPLSDVKKSPVNKTGRLNDEKMKFVPSEIHLGNTLKIKDLGKVLRKNNNPSVVDALEFRNAIQLTKGKQRLHPKKKKLTTLKKNILQERLRQWREKNETGSTDTNKESSRTDSIFFSKEEATVALGNPAVVNLNSTNIVCLKNFANREELEDDEEYEEIFSDLRELSLKVGPIVDILVPRGRTIFSKTGVNFDITPKIGEEPMQMAEGELSKLLMNANNDDLVGFAFVMFQNVVDAEAAVACWSNMCLGGNVIETALFEHRDLNDVKDMFENKKKYCSPKELHSTKGIIKSTSSHVILESILTDNDLEDEESLEECKRDILLLAGQFGRVEHIYLLKEDETNEKKGSVAVVFDGGNEVAEKAAAKLDGLRIGGEILRAKLSPQHYKSGIPQEGQIELSHPVVKLTNLLLPEDFENGKCNEERRSDIMALVSKYGKVGELVVKQCDGLVNEGHIYVKFISENYSVAKYAVDHLDGVTLGERKIRAEIVWNGSKSSEGLEQNTNYETNTYTGEKNHNVRGVVVVLKNVLSDEDFEDEECLEETRRDILSMAKRFGPVSSFRIDVSNDATERGFIYITYNDLQIAKTAAGALNNRIIGGNTISASLMNKATNNIYESSNNMNGGASTIVLGNILNEDDLNDDDCLEETKADIYSLASKFGQPTSLSIETRGEHKSLVYITFADNYEVAANTAELLNDMVIGGSKISATVIALPERFIKVTDDQNNTMPQKNNVIEAGQDGTDNDNTKKDESPPPMFSGDKIIPAQFAACKRVPKIPNAGVPREYASRIPEEYNAVMLVTEMIGELMKFQQRTKDDANARSRRRVVVGLREVARGIRAQKVKMVIMANNLDEYGAIDEKLNEILKLAKDEDVPVLFELNKRKLGKALGKSIKVSVVGIYNADGAYEQFKKLKKYSSLR